MVVPLVPSVIVPFPDCASLHPGYRLDPPLQHPVIRSDDIAD